MLRIEGSVSPVPRISNKITNLSEAEQIAIQVEVLGGVSSTEVKVPFQKYLEDIAKRLYPDHNFDNHPINFELVESDELVGCINTGNPATVFLSTSLFSQSTDNPHSFRSEDELAFVLAHELGHLDCYKKFGKEQKNSKAEEWYADISAVVQKMADANFNVAAARDYFSRLADYEAEKIFGKVILHKDVHGMTGTRVEILEKCISHVDLKKGGLALKTDINNDLYQKFSEAKKGPFYSELIKELRTNNTLSTQEKCKRIFKEIAPLCAIQTRRMNELGDFLIEILNGADDGKKNKAYCVTKAFNYPEAFPFIYRKLEHAAESNVKFGKKYPPVGKMKDVANAASAFIAATTDSDIHKTAEELNRLLEPLHGHIGLLKRTLLPSFDLKQAIKQKPWQKHLNVLEKSSDNNIAKCLWRLGIEDPISFQRVDLELLREFPEFEAVTYPDNPNRLTFSSSGDLYLAKDSKNDNPLSAYRIFQTILSARNNGFSPTGFSYSEAESLIDEIKNLPPKTFLEKFDLYFDALYTQIKSPVAEDFLRGGEHSEESREQFMTNHYKASKILVATFERITNPDTNPDFSGNPEPYLDLVKNFYLSNEWGRTLKQCIEKFAYFPSKTQIKVHPLVEFLIKEQGVFTLEEKALFLDDLKGLVPVNVWRKTLRDFTSNLSYREQLKQINDLGLSTDTAKQYGAELIALNTTIDDVEIPIPELVRDFPGLLIVFPKIDQKKKESILHVVRNTIPPEDPMELIQYYKVLERAKLIPDEEYKKKMSDQIIENLNKETDPKALIALAEAILLAPANFKQGTLHSLRDKYTIKKTSSYEEVANDYVDAKNEGLAVIKGNMTTELIRDVRIVTAAKEAWVHSLYIGFQVLKVLN